MRVYYVEVRKQCSGGCLLERFSVEASSLHEAADLAGERVAGRWDGPFSVRSKDEDCDQPKRQFHRQF